MLPAVYYHYYYYYDNGLRKALIPTHQDILLLRHKLTGLKDDYDGSQLDHCRVIYRLIWQVGSNKNQGQEVETL